MAKDVRFDIRARDRTRTAFDSVDRSLAGMRRGLGAVKAALAVTFVATGATALAAMTKKAIETADNIGKMADAVGVSTDALQEMRHAAELSGVAQDKLDSSLERFTQRLGRAREDTGALAEGLKKLDQELLDQVKAAGSTDEALDLVLRRMAAADDAAERAAVAFAAFGREGVALTNIVRDGTDAYAAMRDEAQRLGLVIDEGLIRSAEAANDQLYRMERILSANLTEALISLSPTVINLGDAAADAAPKLAAFVDSLIPDELAGADELSRRIAEINAQIEVLGTKEGEAYAAARKATGIGPGAAGELAALMRRRDALILYRHEAESAARARQALELDGGGGGGGSGDGERSFPSVDLEATRKPIPPDTREFIDNMQAAIDDARQSQAALNAEAERITMAFDPLARHTAEVDRLNELLDLGVISQQVHGAAVDDASRRLIEATDSTRELTRAAEETGEAFASAFERAALEGQDLGEVMRGLLSDVQALAFRRSVTEPLSAGLGSIFDGIFSALPGFATGGDFTVGGNGGTDSQLVQFRATPGEQVTVEPPTSGGGRGSPMVINKIDARGAELGVEERIRAMLTAEEPRIVQKAVGQSMAAVEAGAHSGGKFAKALGRR